MEISVAASTHHGRPKSIRLGMAHIDMHMDRDVHEIAICLGGTDPALGINGIHTV
ncbi:MAG: hypothetical protein RTU09_04115 [Candidatus Thorarchaeota archaeon]